MYARPIIKVGAVVLVALVLGVATYFYLAHLNLHAYTVRVAFPNTEGLSVQSPVRMEGVQIGEVTTVSLNTSQRPPQPYVDLSIDNKFRIPVDSRFQIVTGLFIANPMVDVLPGPSHVTLARNGKAFARGEPPAAGPQQLMTQASAKFNDLSAKLDTASVKIDQMLDQGNHLLRTANEAATSTKNLITDPRIKKSLIDTVENFRQTSADVRATAGHLGTELTTLVHNGGASVQKLTSKLGDVLTRLDTTVDDANTVVKRLTEQVTDPRFQQSLQDTVELARATIARFNQVAADLDQVLGDPNLQRNLKATVANLNTATHSGEETLNKVNTLLDRLSGVKPHAPHVPPMHFLADISEQINPGRFRIDADARLGISSRDLIDLGLYDFGETTRFNVQLGSTIAPSTLFRYGLYASKLGVGLEYTPPTVFGLRADLWDTVRTHLDVRGLFRVNKEAQFWIGGEDLLHDPAPIIGIQITR